MKHNPCLHKANFQLLRGPGRAWWVELIKPVVKGAAAFLAITLQNALRGIRRW